jgi:hypothetical protein
MNFPSVRGCYGSSFFARTFTTNYNPPSTIEGVIMHSDNIVKTLDTGQNRFALCHQAFKAIRKLHKPNERIQDTAADALKRLAGVAQRESSIGPGNANDATGLEVSQPQPAIAPEAEAPQPESAAGDVSLSSTNVLVPAELTARVSGELVSRP